MRGREREREQSWRKDRKKVLESEREKGSLRGYNDFALTE